MERRAARHQTRLSGAHTAAADTEFQTGQRVRTIDGLIGRVLEVSESWAPGNTAYQVVLDNGMGGGTYLGSQLRPIPQDYGGLHPTPANLPASLGSADGEPPSGENVHLASDTPGFVAENAADGLMAHAVLHGQPPLLTPGPGVPGPDFQDLGGSQFLAVSQLPAKVGRQDPPAPGVAIPHVLGFRPGVEVPG